MITIISKETSFPFSRGLLAQSLTATGISPAIAYDVARTVHSELKQQGATELSSEALRAMATRALEEIAGKKAAARYLELHDIDRLDMPLILLIGGTTGVGKSTLAVELAHRLGITRVSSTDSTREVMRGIFNADLMPTLYESAFDAWKGLRAPIPDGLSPAIAGFNEQTSIVLSGVKSVIARAAHEKYSMVIEGVHIVPGFLDLTQFDKARFVQFIVGVKEQDVHLSHFYMRDVQTGGSRGQDKYEQGFDAIRLLGDYIQKQAVKHDVPILYSHALDQTVENALNLIMDKAFYEVEE